MINKAAPKNKKYSLLLICLLFFSFLHAEEVLTKNNASWSTVLPGVVICQPVETSYGFCIATDARNIIAYTKTGVQLWEKSIGRSKNVELSVLKDDFLVILEKNENILKILNPSGSEIWNTKLNIFPRERALAGFDGRFFVYSEDKIICYGINGVKKWELDTPKQKNIPIQQLPDGSLVVFFMEKDGKTDGLRISPFGKKIEEITFAGQVVQSYSCADGILLTFSDGTSGLFSIQDGFAKNKWVVQKKADKSIFAVSPDLTDYFFIELNKNNIVVNKVSKTDGTITFSKKIESISGNNILTTYCNESGVFVCDKNNAILMNHNGYELFSAKMPAENEQNWNYLFTLNDNYFVFCNKDWSLTAFKIRQNTSESTSNSTKKEYDAFVDENNIPFEVMYSKSFGNKLTAEQRVLNIKNDDIGELEQEYLSETLSICNSYLNDVASSDFGINIEKSIFELDEAGFQNILLQLAQFSNDNTQNKAANIIRKSTNRNYSLILVNNLNGYDPDGQLLNALDIKSQTIAVRDVTYINSICDLVYRICFFMGRPAYNTKGKKILKQFLGPNYNIKNRKYASEVLQKIMALEL